MKDKLKNFLGEILVAIYPKRASELSKGGMTISIDNSLNLKDRLVRHHLLRKVEKNGNLEKLAEFHRNFWKKKGGDFFSRTDRNVLEDFFKPHFSHVIEDLKGLLKDQGKNYETIVEIGTGHGDVLDFMSFEFPQIDRFIGIDLSTSQTKINQIKYCTNKRLKFVAADGLDWIRNQAAGNTIFFTSGGVLEYFTEERLRQLFGEVKKLGRTIFIAMEPIGIGVDFESNPHSRPYGAERSFSHDYVTHFKNAGFRVWHESNIPHKSSEFDFLAVGVVS